MKKIALFVMFLCYGTAHSQSATGTTYSNQKLQDVNLSKIAGVSVSTASGTGALPVTFASTTVITANLSGSLAIASGTINVQNVPGTMLTTDVTTYLTITVSTASCSSSAKLVMSANSSRVANLFCNEGTIPVRLGPSTITTTIGQAVFAGACITYDKPRYYRGPIYCISTGADQPISETEGTP